MRTILVTGSSTGIGRAAAVRQARNGWIVYAGVRRDQDARSVEAEHSNIRALQLDVTDRRQIADAVARVEREQEGLDALVNNAGIAYGGPMELLDSERFRGVFDVNVFGLQDMAAACTPLLRRSRGRMILVGSMGGWATRPFVGPYSATKHAVEAIGNAYRLELAPLGVRVVLVEPGVIRTAIWDKAKEQAHRWVEGEHGDLGPYRARVERALARQVTKLGRHTNSPELVARVIDKALVAHRPKARYAVGLDAKLIITLKRLLPTSWLDKVIRHAAG